MTDRAVSGGAGQPRFQLAMITFGTMLATIMQALDTTIANVALPYMQGAFSATLDQITWVLTSYIVAAAIMTPPTGWLAARFGRKRLYLVSVVGFTVASVFCGIAGSLTEMVVFRIIQGCFGAALVPLSQATLLDNYPTSRHGQAMAIWGVGIMLGPILGPTLGGWLTENYSWRWVFYINVPVGILGFMVIASYVSETARNVRLKFDLFGFLAISIAVAALQMFLDRGQQLDWFGSYEIVIEAIIAALCLYTFLVHTFTAERPFISPSLFRDWNFSLSLIFIFVVGMILYATMALLPPFMQELLNYPVVTVGFLLAPRGIGTMIAMMIVGRIIGPVQPRFLLVFGFALNAVALWWMSTFSLYILPWEVFASGVVQGFGLGFVFVPLTTVGFSTLAPERRTEGAGVYNLLRNIGSSVGISIVAALLERNTQINHATIGAVATPFNPMFRLPLVEHLFNLHTASGLTMLNAEVTRQAAMIGYIDDFRLMMYLSLAVLPFILLLGKPPRGRGLPAAALAD